MKFGGPDKGEKEEIEFFKLNKYLLNTLDYGELFTKILRYTKMEAIYSKKTLKTVAYLYLAVFVS